MGASNWDGLAIPKPEPRKKVKARAERAQSKGDKVIYAYVTARDGGRCRVCGAGGEIHRHHLLGRQFTSRQDVVCLCDGCHADTHVRVGGKKLDIRGNADRFGGLIVRMRFGKVWKVMGRV